MNSILPLSAQHQTATRQSIMRAGFGQQSGFSLIELMVAVLIGLFLTLGLSQIFLSMYSTSQSQGNLNQNQENQRLGIVMLTNTAQLAGFYAGTPTTVNDNATNLPTVTNADGSIFVAGAGIVGTGDGTGTGAASDTLNIYYQSGGSNLDGIINCQGGTAAASTKTTFINSFSINASSQMVCTVTTGGVTSKPLVLANNLASMSILYGVDSVGSNPSSVDTYLTAKAVQSANKWMSVRTVQITLNFYTPNPLNPNQAFNSTSPTTPWVQTINLMAKS